MQEEFFVCVLIVVVFECSGKLPPYIKPCSKNDNLTDCLLRNVENVRPYLTKGIPELGIPSLDPYHIPELVIEKEKFEFKIRSLNYTHFEEFVIERLDFDVDDGVLEVSVNVPRLTAYGTYWFVGWNYGAFFNASGNVLGRAVNCTFDLTMTGRHIVRDNRRFLDMEISEFRYVPLGPGFLYFEDLVAGDREKTLAYNVLINENFESFMRSIDPFTERVLGGLTSTVMRAVFGKYSVDELFVD